DSHSQIGQWCRKDSDCIAENSGCIADICSCLIDFILIKDQCVSAPQRASSKVYLMAIGCLLSVLIFSLSLCFLYWRRKVHERREERDLALSRVLRHTAESWVTFSPSIADDVVYGRLTPAADSVCYLQMFDKPPSYETLCKGHLMVNGSPLRLEAQ
ncbi:unnamed protein product, partial [Ixodes persulcatus]